MKDLKDFMSLEYEPTYYVSTCGLVGKAVEIKSGDPGSNPAGVIFFSFFCLISLFLSSIQPQLRPLHSFMFPNSPVSAISRVKAFLCKIKGTKVVASHN